MAPEQLEGGTISPETDVYALGVVMFEMTTASLPFDGDTPFSVVAKRLQGRAPSPRSVMPELDRDWERVILRCLEREPEDRYASPTEVVTDLRGEHVSRRWTLRQRKRWMLAAAVVGMLLTITGVLTLNRNSYTQLSEAPEFEKRDWVLIADFDNRTGEEVLDDTLEYALRRELSASHHVNVVPPERIADSLRLMKKAKDTDLNRDLAREVSLRDGEIRAFLTGRVEKLGRTFLLTAELVAVADGTIIGSFSEDATSQDELVSAVRRLSSSVRETVGEALTRIRADEQDLARVTTPSLRALRLYSQAQQDYISADQAEALLREAIVEDPGFAVAYMALARSLENQGAPAEEFLPYSHRAIELADSATEWERQWIQGYAAEQRGEWEEALTSWAAVQRLRPDLLLAGPLMATHAFELSQFEEAVPYAVAWAQSRPQNLFANMQATRALAIWAARPDEADPYFERALGLMTEQETELQSAGFLGVMAIDFLLFYPHHLNWLAGDLEGSISVIEEVQASLPDRRGDLKRWLTNSVTAYYLDLGMVESATRAQPTGADSFVILQARSDSTRIEQMLVEAVEKSAVRSAETALLLMRYSRIAEARRVVDSLVERSEASESYGGAGRRPTLAIAAVARGALSIEQGQTKEGVHQLRSGLRQLRASGEPTYFLGTRTLAASLAMQGQIDPAIQTLEDASAQKVRYYPRWKLYWFEIRLQLADLLRSEGRADEAEEIEAELNRLMRLADRDYWLVAELEARGATR